MVTFSDSGGCEGSRHASTNSGCLATNAKAPPYGRAFFRMSHRGALLGRGPLGRSEEGDHRGITCFPAPAHSAPLCPSNPSRPHGGAGRSLVNPGWTTTRSSWVEPEGVEPSSVTAAALVNAKAFRLMCSRVPEQTPYALESNEANTPATREGASGALRQWHPRSHQVQRTIKSMRQTYELCPTAFSTSLTRSASSLGFSTAQRSVSMTK